MSVADERATKIKEMVCKVPAGQVATYGQIAELCGLGRRARLVGKVMSQLEPDTAVPWHRIIAASGRLSLPPDSPSFARQVERLTSEGILVTRDRVPLKRFRWEPDLDELLWGPTRVLPD